jgi:hypothetical protein
MKKSRQGIYLALKENGVDTSLGIRGSKTPTSPIDEFLNGGWRSSTIGRSPNNISLHLGVPVKKVLTCLKNRRNALIALAERVPMEKVLNGAPIMTWEVDAYMNTATFIGEDKFNELKRVTLNKLDLMSILRGLQSGDIR